ncbi:ATP-binding protein [Pedobacter sp. MC2016-15]|uniref:sensor histidine kinase n=1 Tax=Pedobacter sp. MC2016-15 TaxID=2994473 RepID=UPI0022450359|nr:7TM diverse intracellular signaling domain-containing protein [Pedobacter sp. MC2016-15]MCX2480329.1 ATP-binding protein [Pedobacter sp. MC2016-15]
MLFKKHAYKVKTSLIILLLLCCNLLSSAQTAVDFKGKFGVIGNQIEILTDSSSKLTLKDAMASTAFKKSDSEFPNLGITPYSYWIKFSIRNSYSHENLGLQLLQPMIDKINYYQVDNGRIVRSNSSGQTLPFDSRLIKHQSYIYPVVLTKNQTDTFYLHVRSGKQLVLPIYLGSIEQVIENTLTKDITFGIYTGIILVMLLYNLFIFISTKDKNYFYYVVYLAIVLISQACMEGFVFRFILPGEPQIANMFIYIATALIGVAAIEFSKSFLSAKQLTPKLYKVSYLFWFLYTLQIVLAFTGNFNASYGLMLSVAMISALYVLYMAVVIVMKGFRAAKFFLIAWSFFILCVVTYVLKDFNILPYNNLTGSALLIGSGVEAILLSFALADKINIFKAEKERSQEETLRALQENERIIREQNVLLELKVSERTLELSESNHELGITLEDLKQAQSQLVESEKMASLGQLTAGIAHEINNPINFVTANIKPLKRDVDMMFDAFAFIEEISLSDSSIQEKQQKINEYKEELDFDYLIIEINDLLKGIKEGASRTAEIVKGLKIFSRLDEDDLKVADINEGLDSTLVIANNLLNNSIKVTRNFADIPHIECYAGKLNQVFLNIISNGAYAVHKQFGDTPGGEIIITTTADEEYVYINIRDNGTGMDDKTQKKIFEPFFTTKDVGEGTGLGMSIAYNTIKKHNGHIHLKSAAGEGTEFILQLPVIHKVIAL